MGRSDGHQAIPLVVVGCVFSLAGVHLTAADGKSELELSPVPSPEVRGLPAVPEEGDAQDGVPASTSGGTPSQPPVCSESGATCLSCGIGISLPGFDTASEQRAHFKTDWHRYNVRRRVQGQPPVGEESFNALIADHESQVSSISGSSSDSDSDDESTHQQQQQQRGGLAKSLQQVPQFVFQTSRAAGAAAAAAGARGGNGGGGVGGDGGPRHLAVWRCLLCQDHVRAALSAADAAAAQLRALRTLVEPPSAGQARPTWLLAMLRGGHFAGAVLRARGGAALLPGLSSGSPSKQLSVGASGGDGDLPFEVVAHKTFHRYVVRAKGGGKQSSKDGTGKVARSAGSRLRRYNEAALEKDIQDLFATWAEHVKLAQLIFVHAPASNARSVFQPAGGIPAGASAAERAATACLLLPNDPRVRRVPFMIQRPTFSEVKRVARVLSGVFEVPEAAVAAMESAAAAAAAAVEDKAGRAAEKADKAAAVAAAAAAASAAAAAAPVADAAEDADATALGRTEPLHRASAKGQPDRVAALLDEGHDPCALDERGRTAYALAADKNTRDAFRRFMARCPDAWDYAAAGVPSALTDDMEAAQAAKNADKKAKLKAKDSARKEGADERKAAAAAAAAATMEDEIAAAAAEAAALSAKLGNMRTAAAAAPSSKVGRGGGAAPAPVQQGRGGFGGRSSGATGSSSSAGRTAGAGGRSGGSGGRAAGGATGRPGQAEAAAPERAPTAEEVAARRERAAAAAEARARALSGAAQQQRLW